MRSLIRSSGASFQALPGQSSHQHAHSSSRWERDLRRLRSESLSGSSRAPSLTNVLSFDDSPSWLGMSNDSFQMSSIFEPETEVGLYDDDNESHAARALSNVSPSSKQLYGLPAQRQQPQHIFAATDIKTSKGLKTDTPQVRVKFEPSEYNSGDSNVIALVPETNALTGCETVDAKSIGSGCSTASGVICIELEPPTPTTDEDAQFGCGIISFQSPPEPSTPTSPLSAVLNQHYHSFSAIASSAECSHQQRHQWDSDNGNTETVASSPSVCSHPTDYQCTQRNISSPASQPHEDLFLTDQTMTATTTTGMTSVRESPAGVVDNSSSCSNNNSKDNSSSATDEGNNPQHKT